MDQSVQIRAYVEDARENGGVATLKQLRTQCIAAINAGDQEVNTLSFEGGSAGGKRCFNSQDLLEVVQLAIEELEDRAEPLSLVPDFSRRVVTL